jgi:hypothetical protein
VLLQLPSTAITVRCGLTNKVSEMADEPREHHAKENIYAFLQRRSIEQRRSHLARGRCFVVLDVGQLNKSWITAVKNWLARKDRASEITMDDLTAELRLRLTTPLNKSWPLASPEWTRPRKGKLEENSREIDMFRRENTICASWSARFVAWHASQSQIRAIIPDLAVRGIGSTAGRDRPDSL